MKRVILHWSAGRYIPCSSDFEHYHYLIGKQGQIYMGKYKVEDNLDCKDKKYAAHCANFNTGSIGIALCAMYGFKNKSDVGEFPILKVQAERAFKLCAQLLKKYKLAPSKNTILTHYEVGKLMPYSSNASKIDITCLPYKKELKADDVIDYIRNKVRWYYEQ